MDCPSLVMFNAGHREGDISLGLVGETLYGFKELWPGCNSDVAIHLAVNKFGALECMVFIPNDITWAKSTGTEFPGGIGVAA